MGNRASKAMPGRRLERAVPSKTLPKPSVGSSRGPLADRESFGDATEKEDLSNRLTQLGQARTEMSTPRVRPASENPFVATLHYRERLDIEGQRLSNASGPKTVAPAQTIAAVVKSLQAGADRDDLINTYDLAVETLDKLSNYRIPEEVNQLPRRRPRM